MSNAIVLLSGGLDSTTTLYYVKKKLKPKKIISLFIDYNQSPLKEEEYCARKISKELKADFKKIDFRWLGEISTSLINKDKTKSKKEIIKWWVPCRNSLFLLTALAHAESKFLSKKEKYDVFIGIKYEGESPMKDTTPKFLEQANKLVKEATAQGNYKLIAPLINKGKDETIKLAKELKVPLKYTYSCYKGNNFSKKKLIHCGTCLNCTQRKQAFYWSNTKDPSIYNK